MRAERGARKRARPTTSLICKYAGPAPLFLFEANNTLSREGKRGHNVLKVVPLVSDHHFSNR